MEMIMESLSKTYKSSIEKKLVLNNISCHVNKGEWINIIGPSGSGKTTLLKCVAGIMNADAGSKVSIGGLDMGNASEEEKRDFRRRNIGYIFQEYELFSAYTAKQNVMLPEWPYKKEAELRERSETLLRTLGLEDRIDAVPTNLSGGEKQRVAIARALLNDPSLLICDEPTGNLDRASRDNVLHILKECQAEGRTIFFVTHDYDVLPYGDRVFQLKDGTMEEINKKSFILQP
ncbi:ABC transporter ATP-binding protein [Ornithinibacillus salinisoli]|uniref:ABC transporter ATP-binding protein n=1 Tax=Ornithinibacillus salinisoli TaxID=1848459 RepID=A0ABW4VUF8_9BACI